MALRMAIWLVHVSIPAFGLWLLVENPHLDVHYEHHGVHFWLVLATASVAMALGIVLLRAARMRADARLILVSLVFQFNAGFLALHALATPGVILQTPNAGFVAATPMGLVLGGIASQASELQGSLRSAVDKAEQWLQDAGVSADKAQQVLDRLRESAAG